MMIARADVYRNLHASPPAWSVRNRSTGRVVARPAGVLVTGASFVVSAAGRERVLREGRKNVHAFVRGCVDTDASEPDLSGWAEVTYNPYRFASFVTASGHVTVLRAEAVWLSPAMRVWARFSTEATPR